MVAYPMYPEFGAVRIIRHRHVYLHVVRRTSPLELTLHFYEVLHPAPLVRLHGSLDPHEWLDGGGDAIRHELKLAVGRDERDRAIGLKAGESDALMEFDILHLDCLPTCV
jgi:hypothetical protein